MDRPKKTCSPEIGNKGQPRECAALAKCQHFLSAPSYRRNAGSVRKKTQQQQQQQQQQWRVSYVIDFLAKGRNYGDGLLSRHSNRCGRSISDDGAASEVDRP